MRGISAAQSMKMKWHMPLGTQICTTVLISPDRAIGTPRGRSRCQTGLQIASASAPLPKNEVPRMAARLTPAEVHAGWWNVNCCDGKFGALRGIALGDHSGDHLGIDLDEVGDEVLDALPGSVVLRPQFQIFDSVVRFVAVDVVNRLFGTKRSPEVLGHREAVAVGVPLSVGVRAVLPDPNSRVAVRRQDGSDLAPGPLEASPAVEARSASGAVPTARGACAVAVGILAGALCSASPRSTARDGAPLLGIRSRRVGVTTLHAGPFDSHPWASLVTSRIAVFLPVFGRNEERFASDTRAGSVCVTHSYIISSFTFASLFDRHRRYGKCVDPATFRDGNGALVFKDAGRAYPCWSGAADEAPTWADRVRA